MQRLMEGRRVELNRTSRYMPSCDISIRSEKDISSLPSILSILVPHPIHSHSTTSYKMGDHVTRNSPSPPCVLMSLSRLLLSENCLPKS
jgi:hypothetical protein